MEKQKLPDSTTTDFLAQTPGQAFKAQGFYDYGSNAPTLRLDFVDYSLSISSDGDITGTSCDAAGSATISGKIDFETTKVWFTKAYGFQNLWATWAYSGRLSRDGTAIAGFYARSTDPVGKARFGIWIANASINREKAALQMLLRMHTQHEAALASKVDRERCIQAKSDPDGKEPREAEDHV